MFWNEFLTFINSSHNFKFYELVLMSFCFYLCGIFERNFEIRVLGDKKYKYIGKGEKNEKGD